MMQEVVKERLREAGIDVSGALERFMGNEDLLERFLKKFLNDSNYEKLMTAIEEGNQEDALTAAHTLKGVTGNLAMTELFDLLTSQVSAFRNDNWDEAVKLMPAISQSHERLVSVISSME